MTGKNYQYLLTRNSFNKPPLQEVIIKVDMANEPKQQRHFAENSIVEKNNNTRTVQAESSKFA